MHILFEKVRKGNNISIVVLIFLSSCLISDSDGQSQVTTCTSKQTCAECIRSPECAWCSQPDFHGADKQLLARCNTTIGHIGLGRFECMPEFFFHPQNEVDKTKDAQISHSEKGGIPLRPQEYVLKLRVGVPAELEIFYEDPEDYPLDLYYLMDLTKTMEDDKKVLATLGDQLAIRIKDITKKFRQGFGSFIDKVTMPYVQMVPELLENPCLNAKQTCAKPYGFQHHLTLSSDTSKFNEVVENTMLSGSIDNPEGGLDALMQTIVCKEEIGWQEQSRRLVIYASDAPFHIAGDGKLGGILRPNDGECHLDKSGAYTHSTKMDYPSIAQLNQRAIQNSINIIFAVTANQAEIYNKLSSRIEGAKSGMISQNSSNIVDLVEQEYRRITSKVQMSDTLPKNYVKVKYYSKCLNEALDEEMETDTCEEMPIGSTVSFKVVIELVECPTNKLEWNQTYRIYRVGLTYGISVQLNMLCDCPCENPDNWIPNSPKCNGVGTEKCGLCECGDNYFGNLCQCSAKDGVPLDETQACKAPNSTEICSGRGDCFCNQCLCNKRPNPAEKYSGPFCECDNFSCVQSNGEICSGQGECKCGECHCDQGWIGKDCSCSTSLSTCKAPGSTEMCNGQGKCECGKCKCDGKYSGQFCEKCRHESCPNKCLELKPCVQCKVFGTGEIENPADCELNCFTTPIKLVDVIQYDYDSDEVMCREKDETDQCTIYFLYGQNPDKSNYVFAQRIKECPFEAPLQWIAVGIISLVLLIGLIVFIIWKVVTLIKDRAEFAEFQKESVGAAFGTTTNPLYDDPIGHYENPIYGKRFE